MVDFNAEVFKGWKYRNDNDGKSFCPEGCGQTFSINPSGTSFTLDDTRMIWTHVRDLHPGYFRTMYDERLTNLVFLPRQTMVACATKIVGLSYGKVNEILIEFLATASMNSQQALAAIGKEQEEMQHKLADLFFSLPVTQQEQQTSSSSLGSL